MIAGPGGSLRFEPEELTVETGDAVAWGFDSPSHNVSCRPEHSSRVRLPDDAEPFSSYGPDEPPGTTLPRGATYEHTFSVPGTYVYVCIPHQSSGMVGRIHVEG